MTLTIRNFIIDETGAPVEAIQIDGTKEQLEQLRASDWADDQIRLLTYPTAPPAAFLGDEPPLVGLGIHLSTSNYLAKGVAGDFKAFPAEIFEASTTEVTE
jgi:hypothetical protein